MSRIKIYTVFKGTDREFTGNRKEISEHFNIKLKRIEKRIYEKHMTLEEAINYNSSKENNKCKIYTIFEK